jgi:hypothetical protein
MTASYAPVLMTHAGATVAAIVDIEAFELVVHKLDQVQARRDAGTLPTPAGWSQLRADLCEFLGVADEEAATA